LSNFQFRSVVNGGRPIELIEATNQLKATLLEEGVGSFQWCPRGQEAGSLRMPVRPSLLNLMVGACG